MGQGSVRLLLLSAATLSLVAACAGPSAPRAVPAGDVGPQRPTAVGDEVRVTADRLTQPIVIDDIPAPLRVTSVDYNVDYAFPGVGSTLYADPDRADTLDGPVLVVGYGYGSACLPGPPDNVDTEDVDLGQFDGRLTRFGDHVFVGAYGNDVVSFVLARGVPEDEVIAAAATLDPEPDGGVTGDEATVLPPDSVPAGLAPVVTGPGGSGVLGDAGERLYLGGGSVRRGPGVSVSVVRADPRLAALWGAWLDDPGGTTIRGSAGSAGPLRVTSCSSPALGRVWAEDGMVFAVEGQNGADAGLVDAVVAGLRLGTDEELSAVQQSVVDAPVTAVDAGCWADSAVVSGVMDGVRWVFAVGTQPDFPDLGPQECSTLITARGSAGTGSGSLTISAPGRLTVSSFAGISEADVSGRIVAGIAPAGTTRVTITALGSGSTTEAVLGPVVTTEVGPREGDRLFGAFFPGEQSFDSRYTVTAFGADGAVLHRLTP